MSEKMTEEQIQAKCLELDHRLGCESSNPKGLERSAFYANARVMTLSMLIHPNLVAFAQANQLLDFMASLSGANRKVAGSSRGKLRNEVRSLKGNLNRANDIIGERDKIIATQKILLASAKEEMEKYILIIKELEDDIETETGERPDKLGTAGSDRQKAIAAYDAMPKRELICALCTQTPCRCGKLATGTEAPVEETNE